MKCISCTLKNEERDLQYEFVNTGHAEKRLVQGLAYACHYQLSHVPRSTFELQDRARYWQRLGDMIRIPGIQGKLKMIVKPKSGFRIRVLLLQTPFRFSGLVGDGPVEDDNAGSLPSDEDPMGSFRPSLEHMSQIVENEEGMVCCSLNPRFAPLFDRQMPVMNDMN